MSTPPTPRWPRLSRPERSWVKPPFWSRIRRRSSSTGCWAVSLGEVGRIADEGTPVAVVDTAFAGVAPMPPYVLIALVGPAIAYHNNETLTKAFPERFYRRRICTRWSKRANGRSTVPTENSDPEVESLLVVGDKQLSPEEVRSITPRRPRRRNPQDAR